MTTTLDELAAAVSSPEFERDPFPFYQRILDVPPWRAPSGAYVISKYTTLREVLGDHETFGQHLAPWPNFHRLNPPEHSRMRKLVSKAFTPKSIAALQSDIDAISAELLSRVGGSFDMITDYALHLPARIVAKMIGVPASDAELWHGWLHRMGRFGFQNPFTAKDEEGEQREIIADAQAANAEQAEYFSEIIEARQRVRGNDIVSRLIDAREADDRLTDEEVRYILVLLLQGGLHTTVHMIGNTIRTLLEHPDQQAEIRADAALVPKAIDEALRLRGILQTEVRITRKAVVVEAVEIAEREKVIILNAAANRDIHNTCDRFSRPKPSTISNCTRWIAAPTAAVRFGQPSGRPLYCNKSKSPKRQRSSPSIEAWPIGAHIAGSVITPRCRTPRPRRGSSAHA